jgi:anti-anti-sigma regulatory factor
MNQFKCLSFLLLFALSPMVAEEKSQLTQHIINLRKEISAESWVKAKDTLQKIDSEATTLDALAALLPVIGSLAIEVGNNGVNSEEEANVLFSFTDYVLKAGVIKGLKNHSEAKDVSQLTLALLSGTQWIESKPADKANEVYTAIFTRSLEILLLVHELHMELQKTATDTTLPKIVIDEAGTPHVSKSAHDKQLIFEVSRCRNDIITFVRIVRENHKNIQVPKLVLERLQTANLIEATGLR